MSLRLVLLFTLSLFLWQPATAVVTPKPEAPPTETEVREMLKEQRQAERENLSRKERRELRRERRRELRGLLQDFRRGDVDGETVLYAILAIFLPPLAVFLAEGQRSTANLYLNLLLTLGGLVLILLLGGFFWFLPAIVHALFIVFS